MQSKAEDYERAVRVLMDGDVSAALNVYTEAIRRDDPKGLLLSLAAGEPEKRAFKTILDAERRLRQEGLADDVLHAGQRLLERWPDTARLVTRFADITPLVRTLRRRSDWESASEDRKLIRELASSPNLAFLTGL